MNNTDDPRPTALPRSLISMVKMNLASDVKEKCVEEEKRGELHMRLFRLPLAASISNDAGAEQLCGKRGETG